MNNNRKENLKLVGVAGLTVLAVGALGVKTHVELSEKSLTTEAATHAMQKTLAKEEAQKLQEKLFVAGKDVSAKLDVWQGYIKHVDGSKTTYIANPIVLRPGLSDSFATIPTSNSESPSFYGVIEKQGTGDFAIVEHQFEPNDTYTSFDNYNGSDERLTVDTYISGTEDYVQAFAFDPLGNGQVLNQDGSLLSPGLILPQDRK